MLKLCGIKSFLLVLLMAVTLKADYNSAVGVITEFSWGSGPLDPIYITCRVSQDDRARIREFIILSSSTPRVTFKFNIFDFDAAEPVWYIKAHTNDAELEGTILNVGEDYLYIEDYPATDVQSPPNFELRFAVVPEEIEQFIYLAFAADAPLTKYWGQTVTPKSARMQADLDLVCSAQNGFYFDGDVHNSVGHLTKLTIGDLYLAQNFMVENPDGQVPVVLSGFSAVVTGNGVELSWTTESEENCLGFNVLRSDGAQRPFVKVNGAVIPGAGTIADPQEYSYTDRTAGDRQYYYRLEQVDRDGSKELSRMVTVGAGTAGSDFTPGVLSITKAGGLFNNGRVYNAQGRRVVPEKTGVYFVVEDGKVMAQVMVR